MVVAEADEIPPPPSNPLPEAAGAYRFVRQALDEYYGLRGWDENGVPTREKLKELGLL